MNIKRKIKNVLRPIIRFFIIKIKYRKINGLKSKFFSDLKKIIFSKQYDAVIIFDNYFGFNMKMFQRPQHMAINLSNENILYFYKTSSCIDNDVKVYKEIKHNLYLINTDIYWVQEGLLDMVKESRIEAFVQIYCTAFMEYDKYVKKFLDRGFKIIYEFIDELSDDIAGFKLTDDIKDSHMRMLEDSKNIYVITTADKLYNEAKQIRGQKRLALIENGVELGHFSNVNLNYIPEQIKNVVNSNKKIIGYFGALAKWFDYELITKISNRFKDINILLIGVDYDKSIVNSGILNLPNVYYVGTVEYNNLPHYSKFFNISVIPFVINNITKSTSPVKLFEYMDLGKPIVTTNLPECRKYKSPLISENHDEFMTNIKRAILLEDNYEYISLIENEKNNNTWKQRAISMKNFILNS